MKRNNNHDVLVSEARDKGIAKIIINGNKKLERLRKSRAGLKQLMEQVHVEPEATQWNQSSQRGLLSDQCANFLNQKNQKVFVLLGDPGAGKTRFMERFFENCLSEFEIGLKQADQESFVPPPLLINLYEAFQDDKIRPKFFLNDYLERKVGLDIFEIEALTDKPLLILCDGFDEINFSGNLYLGNDWEDKWPNLKCIISSRPEKFGTALSNDELQTALVETFSPVERSALLVFQLSPFSPPQVTDFIVKWQSLSDHSQWTVEQYQKELADIPGLQELTTNPVILSLVLYSLPKIVKDRAMESDGMNRKRFQRMDIYDKFVNVWFQDQSLRLEKKLEQEQPGLLKKIKAHYGELYGEGDASQAKEDDDEENANQVKKHYFVEPLRSYTTQLAYWTVLNHQSSKLNLEIPEYVTLQPYLLNNPTHETQRPMTSILDEGESIVLCWALRSGCLLNCEGGSNELLVENEKSSGARKPITRYFRFFHKSLVEYFAQAYIFTGVAGLLQLTVEEYSEFILVLMEEHKASDKVVLQQLSKKYSNAPLLIKTDEKFFIWGCLNQKWKLTELRDAEDIIACSQFEFLQEPQRIKNLNIFTTLKKGHSLASHPAQVLNQRLTDVNLLRMLAERVKQESCGAMQSLFKNHLHLIIQESRNNPAVAHAAANAITILNYAGEPVNEVCWPQIQIPGADLSDAFLSRANLQGADLSGVCFQGAYLAEANLEGAWVRGCEWGVPNEPLHFDGIVRVLLYTSDGEWLIVGDDSGKISFVHGQSFKIEAIATHYSASIFAGDGDAVYSLAVNGSKTTPSSCWASGSNDGRIYLWPLPKRSLKKKLLKKQGGGTINALAFHPDGIHLASGSHTGVINLWDTCRAVLLKKLTNHDGPITCLAYSPKGDQLASGSYEGVHLWQPERGTSQVLYIGGLAPGLYSTDKFTYRVALLSSVSCIAYSPQGDQLAAGRGDNIVSLWQQQPFTGRATSGLEGNTGGGRVYCVAYSAQGDQLARGSSSGAIYLYQIGSKDCQVISGHTNMVWCLAYSPQGDQLASGSADKTVRLWQLSKDVSPMLRQHTNNVNCVAYSPQGDQLASGSEDGTIHLWSLSESGCEVLGDKISHKVVTARYGIICVAYFPKDDQLVSGSYAKLCLWQISDNSVQVLVSKPAIRCIAYSSQADQMAWGSYNKVYLWQVGDKKIFRVLQKHIGEVNCVAYSPQGDQAASGGEDNIVYLWPLAGGEPCALQGHTSGIVCVSYSPQGDQVASGSSDNTVRLWPLSGDEPRVLRGHTNWVTCVAYSLQKNQLASGSRDKTVRLWDTRTGICLNVVIEVDFEVLNFFWKDFLLKIAGRYDDIKVQSLTYDLTSSVPRLCQWLDRKGPPFSTRPLHKTNLTQVRGLSASHYTFLQSQGAIGKPCEFLPVTISQQEAENKSKDLAEVVAIQKILLQKRGHLQILGQSVVNEKKLISYHQWQVYLLRKTQPSASNGSSLSSGNRHVYALLEGLDQIGRRVFIRFDLLKNRADPSLATIRVKASFVEGTLALPEGQAAFMSLFQKDDGELPTQLVCHHAGSFKQIDQTHKLLAKIVDEHSRQSISERASSHIRYQFRGGNERSNKAHNCLSWLRYMLGEFKELKMPHSAMDKLFADPQSVLPTPSKFFTSPLELKVMDTRGWAAQANELILVSKQKKGLFSN